MIRELKQLAREEKGHVQVVEVNNSAFPRFLLRSSTRKA